MLRFTVTTSRLYNVDIKLRARARWITVPWVFFGFFLRAIPAQPPCLDTSFIYVLGNRADSTALTFFFCLYWARSRNWYRKALEPTLKLAISLENSNLAQQLDRYDFSSEISPIHLANFQQKTFSTSPNFLWIPQPIRFLLAVAAVSYYQEELQEATSNLAAAKEIC